MKKFLSLILSLVMVLGVSTVTFADTQADTEEETYNHLTEITISKVYEYLNNIDGINDPKETLEFEIEKVSVSESESTQMPDFNPKTFSISYDKDNNITSSDPIELPEFSHVGIYTYKITEKPGNTAGVIYSEPLFLKVTVIQQGDDLVTASASLYKVTKDEDEKVVETKVQSFTNTYKAGNLTISKTVTGNMGERERDFTVKVKLTAPEGKTVNSTISVDNTYAPSNNITNIEIGNETSFTLKHGESIIIKNIPYDVKYEVLEVYVEDGYDQPQYKVNDGNTTTQMVRDSINDASETVEITNNKGMDVNMGILVDNLPYIIILAGVVVGMGVFFIKKRTANNN